MTQAAEVPTAARRALFTEQLLQAQAKQREAGRQIAVWLEALKALDNEMPPTG